MMEEMTTCGSCKYANMDVCLVPLYVDSEFYAGRAVTDEKPACNLYEAKDALFDE